MNKKDTQALSDMIQNMNESAADIDNGRFEIYATPRTRGKNATFVMWDKAWHETEDFETRFYTLKTNDNKTIYPFEIMRKWNDFIVERRGK